KAGNAQFPHLIAEINLALVKISQTTEKHSRSGNEDTRRLRGAVGKTCKVMRRRTIKKRKPPMKAKSSRFDSLVARYYPAVYSFASRLTDDPREAVLLTHDAFNSTRKQLQSRRDEVTLVTILLNAVIRAGFTAA